MEYGKIMEEIVEKIKQTVQEAEMVLVGFGEEFGLSEKEIMEQHPALFVAEQESEQRLGYLVRQGIQRQDVSEFLCAYRNICDLIQNKNYFLISTNMDGIIKRLPFREDRMVTPCGGYEKLQCPSGCGDVWEAPQKEWDAWAGRCLEKSAIQDAISIKGETPMLEEASPMKMAVCPKCGRELVFHNIFAEKYKRDEQTWNRYMKWMQGTMNKKVCILELGAGMRFDALIHHPFEQMAIYNQKAVYFRVHSTSCEMPSAIGTRGFQIKENPVYFFANKFVCGQEL